MHLDNKSTSCSLAFLEGMKGYRSNNGEYGGGYHHYNSYESLSDSVRRILESSKKCPPLYMISFVIAQPLQTTSTESVEELDKLGFRVAEPFGRNAKYLHADALYVARGYEVLAAIIRLVKRGELPGLDIANLNYLESMRSLFNHTPRGTFREMYDDHELTSCDGDDDCEDYCSCCDDNELETDSDDVSNWDKAYALPTINEEGELS